MDSAALEALIAEVRGTAAALLKPSSGSHRPRLNLPSRARAPNPLRRLGRPLQSVATRDGWPPAERPCPPRGFF
jgi:hypothetical protein